nr:MAG TPA: helix-turn-helix domain-containing protein [Bacteriophage sp.]
MKAVLRSIKPYWLYLILTGKKTIEVGKSCPKSKDWNKVVEMYCSKDIRSFNRIPEKDREWMHKYLGKVAGLFVCDDITKIVTWQRTWFDILQHPIGTTTEYGIWNDDFKQMCLTWKEINDYGKKKPLYGWHISQLKIYDKPKELKEFGRKCDYASEIHCRDCLILGDWDNCCGVMCKPLTRPPQSWCYVQELEDA